MKTLRFSVVLVLMLTRCTSIDLESEFLHDNELQRGFWIKPVTRSPISILCF